MSKRTPETSIVETTTTNATAHAGEADVAEPPVSLAPSVLASDLDGTLIPLAGNEQNKSDLQTLNDALSQAGMALVFVTGRHLESILDVAEENGLPTPDWIICDVGSGIFQRHEDTHYRRTDAYATHLRSILGEHTVQAMHEELVVVEQLSKQEEEKQTEFKLSYYCATQSLEECTAAIEAILASGDFPFSVISSIDPFEDRGLIDLLPLRVSKAYALQWWCRQAGYEHDQIIYAGDSGNDSAALAAGYRAIVVGNAASSVLAAARAAHRAGNWDDRLYAAQAPATSGVLEGLRYFLCRS